MKQFKKLNQTGFSHLLVLPVLIIFGVASYGSYTIVKSFADTKAGTVQLSSEQGCWLAGRVWGKRNAADATNGCLARCRVSGTEYLKRSDNQLGYCKGHVAVKASVETCVIKRHRYFIDNVGCSRKPSQTDGVDTKYCLPGYPYYNANYVNKAEDTPSLIDFCEKSKTAANHNESTGTPGTTPTNSGGQNPGNGGGGNGGSGGGNTGGNGGSGGGNTGGGNHGGGNNGGNPQPNTPKITKVLVFVEENHSLEQMKSGMPYAYSLAQKYGYATNYTATTHPSLPNYIAIAGGTTHGIKNDADPSTNKVNAASVFKQAISKGKTAGVFADGMNGNCALTNGGNKYAVRHNPWTYFVNERDLCAKYDRPISALAGAVSAGTLPNVGMVIPNTCNDAHDCPLKTADGWFKSQITTVMNGADWKSGHLAIVLTADEDDKQSGNKVLTVVMNPSLKSKVVKDHLTHYSLSRMLSEVSGSQPMYNAKGARSLTNSFGLQF